MTNNVKLIFVKIQYRWQINCFNPFSRILDFSLYLYKKFFNLLFVIFYKTSSNCLLQKKNYDRIEVNKSSFYFYQNQFYMNFN